MKFLCEICNKKHDIYFGINAEDSLRLSEIKKDNALRIKEFDGFTIVDKTKIVLLGEMKIKTEYEIDFFYQTWVEVELKLFISFSEAYDGSKRGFLNGRLFEDLYPYFPNSKELECSMKYVNDMQSHEFPEITITEESKLKSIQEKGLSKLEILNLMTHLHHLEK